MKLVVSFLYPIAVFLSLRFFDIKLDDMLFLKSLPLLISVYIWVLICLSYFDGGSFILKFAERFSKKEFCDKERAYIRRSTLFWATVSFVNVILHIAVLLHASEYYWVAYTSFGWYFVFALGGVLQYVHRRFVFLKRVKNA